MVPRAKKKKRTNVPEPPERRRIMQANMMCIAVAIEHLYEDYGWRTKRINRLVETYWSEMCEAKRLQNEDHVSRVYRYIAAQAEKATGAVIISECKGMDKYRADCFMLCVGCLVLALRKLSLNKLRCQIIAKDIFYQLETYEPWSIYQSVYELTGYDVRTNIKWD